jgi:3-hydroxymyristoyl/3-hydroxydecanoyl-(acyl carrier protein) dehydratase
MAPSTEIRFPTDHPTAAGHFPGDPIIPGALLLDAVVEAIMAEAGGGTVIIRSAKFFRALRPGESVDLQWERQPSGAISFACHRLGDEGPAAAGMIEIGGTPA